MPNLEAEATLKFLKKVKVIILYLKTRQFEFAKDLPNAKKMIDRKLRKHPYWIASDVMVFWDTKPLKTRIDNVRSIGFPIE